MGLDDGQHPGVRRLTTIVLLAVLVCGAACSTDESIETARTAPGSVLPAPPVPLDRYPLQFVAGDHYFVVHRENSLEWRSIAAYSFEERTWRELPVPPVLSGMSSAWDGSHLAIIGLEDCEPEHLRCTEGTPTAAFIEPLDGDWEIVDLGMGRIEVSPEVGWGLSAFAGFDRSTILQDEAGRLGRLTRHGSVTYSAPGPGRRPCLVGDTLVAASLASGFDPVTTPLTPNNVELLTLPADFESGERWASQTAALPAMPDTAAEVRAVCGGRGVVLLDVVNERALTWGPGDRSWTLVSNLGEGPQYHDTADRLQRTASGDLVGIERRRDGQYVFRLDLDHPDGARWTRQQAEWVVVDVLGDRVLLHPDQRATPNDRQTWRLFEADV